MDGAVKQFKALAPNTAALLLSSDDDKTKILCVAIVPVVCTYVHMYTCIRMLLYPQYMYVHVLCWGGHCTCGGNDYVHYA